MSKKKIASDQISSDDFLEVRLSLPFPRVVTQKGNLELAVCSLNVRPESGVWR